MNLRYIPMRNGQRVQCSHCMKLTERAYADDDDKGAYVCPYCAPIANITEISNV
jgi:uncharacterized Zn-finger protein